MGDRICIKVTDGKNVSPTLYCHWAGLRALGHLHRALKRSRCDPSNVMCNLIVISMDGRCMDSSFYLYNEGEAKGIADWDNWEWTFDLRDSMWSTTMPSVGKRLTIADVEGMIFEQYSDYDGRCE